LEQLHTIKENGVKGVEIQTCLPMRNYDSWVLVILPAFFLMKNWPEDMGLNPDGAVESVKTVASSDKVNNLSEDEEWTYGKIFSEFLQISIEDMAEKLYATEYL
jgi:hypothetical protein